MPRRFNNRGVAYQKKADYDHAIADLDESIRLFADYAGAYANRAETFVKIGQFDRAIRDYTEAIRLQPAFVGDMEWAMLGSRRQWRFGWSSGRLQ